MAKDNKKMKKIFPRLPEHLDRRYKILPSERKTIANKRNEGMTINYLAKEYNVSVTTIRHIVFPEEKRKALLRVAARNKRMREKGGEKYKERERKRNSERRKYARSVLHDEYNAYYMSLRKPEYWKRGNKKKWDKIKNNPKLLKKYNEAQVKYCIKNRDKINKDARKNYHLRKLKASSQEKI